MFNKFNNHLVSVIIPAFNAAAFIETTIHSVLNQTYKNIECIVVDDGSKDTTSDIIENLAKQDNRVKLIKQNNQGVAAARNFGVANSNGKHIAFLDADDIWLPEHLELLNHELESKKQKFVQSNYQTINQNNEKLYPPSKAMGGNIFSHLLLGKYDYFSGPSGIMVTRSVFDKIGNFDINLSNVADWDFFVRCAQQFEIGLVNKVTWLYRLHTNNMHANINLLEKDTLYIFKKLRKSKSFPSFIVKLKSFSNMYWMLGGSFMNTNKYKTIKYVLLSVLIYPPKIFNVTKALTKN